MNSLTSASASVQSSSNSALRLMKTKDSLLNLLSDSSQSAYAASMSASQISSIDHNSQVRQKMHSFRAAMSVLSDHKLTLSMASNSSATSSSLSSSDWDRIQQTLSQLNSNAQELQKYLDSRS